MESHRRTGGQIHSRYLNLGVIFTNISHSYTDFLVNEIRKDGTVVHLYNYRVDEEAERHAVSYLPQTPYGHVLICGL